MATKVRRNKFQNVYKRSSLETSFKFLTLSDKWQTAGLPQPEFQFRFHPKREWRWDYALPLGTSGGWFPGVAIELQGGTWINGAHVRGGGYQEDCDKANEGTALGWKVLRFTEADLEDIPKVIKLIERCWRG